MKTLFKYLCFFILIIPIYGQERRQNFNSKAFEKIEQIEMAKLVNILDLKEETSIRFFARRKEHREKMESLMRKRRDLIDNISDLLRKEENMDQGIYKSKLNEIFEIDKSIADERIEYYKSLQNILTNKQILKLISFEENFRKEIRETFLRRMEKRR